jgi:hypothetical protein
VPRTELDRLLAQGATAIVAAQPTTAGPAEATGILAEALERANRLLGRRSAARRAELAQGLQGLSEAVEAAIHMLSDSSGGRRVHAVTTPANPSR